jgi:hypothetical protein
VREGSSGRTTEVREAKEVLLFPVQYRKIIAFVRTASRGEMESDGFRPVKRPPQATPGARPRTVSSRDDALARRSATHRVLLVWTARVLADLIKRLILFYLFTYHF